MLKSSIFLFAIILLFQVPIFAQNGPFYKHVIMPDGPFKGQILDTKHLRGIVYLNGSTHQVPQAQAAIYGYIANVHHNGKYYVARIPYNNFSSVDFIYEKFTDMVGGHADLVYESSRPKSIELIYEIVDVATDKGYEYRRLEDPIRLSELVFSAEAVKVHGDKTKLTEGGITNKFAITYRLTSIPQRMNEPVIREGRKTTAIRVPYDPTTTTKSFWEMVARSSHVGMSTNYNLITNNCITSAVDALALGLDDRYRKLVTGEMNRAAEALNRLQIENLTDTKIRDLFQNYLRFLQSHGYSVSYQSILDKSYFVDWLSADDMQTLGVCRKTNF
jgi:hypothetical protein